MKLLQTKKNTFICAIIGEINVEKQEISTSDGQKDASREGKKRGQSLFQSFKPVIKFDTLNSNPKEDVWQRMVGNYKDQKARRGHGFL